MNTVIKVLDHGFVRLVSYMQPVPYEITGEQAVGRYIHDEWSGDLEVIRNARVSYNADWRTGDDEGKDRRLIERMLEGRHSSPFESMVFTFEVKAPIFIFRQWHRHRTWSYNELSARYAPLQEEFYVPDPAIVGWQDPHEKQARKLEHDDVKKFSEYSHWASEVIKDCCELAFYKYRTLLDAGVPRELARGVLPLNTYSRMFATVDLHNLKHFLTLRLDKHAQWEIQQYAKALQQLVEPICPVSMSAFEAQRIK